MHAQCVLHAVFVRIFLGGVHVQESQEQHQKANDAFRGIACLTVDLALQR